MTGEPKTFTVDGEIYSMENKRGHVFCYGVHVPSVTRPGINTDRVPGSITDWAHDVLYQDYRRDAGRKVRITLEILPAEEAADPAGDCPLVFTPADSNHNCTCTQPAGHVEEGKPHICPECGAFTLASERRFTDLTEMSEDPEWLGI